jgi:lysophospholipase L1-like esterase
MTTRFLPRSLPVFLFLVLFLLVAGRSHAETYTVDAFGDSITAGWWVYARDGNGCVGCGGYEPALQSLLKSAGRDAVVKNWGKGGESTSGGASRVGSVLSYDKPRYILLMEGTNDLLFLSPYTVRANMAYMVDVSLARGVVPVLGTITPDFRRGKPISLTNDLLRELALQKNIPFADHFSALISNWSSLSVDGLHPNSAGYAKMAEVWFNAMKTVNITPILMLLLDE